MFDSLLIILFMYKLLAIIDRIIKIQKIAKIMIFIKKHLFFSKGLYWLTWWNMGRNWPLGVFNVFLKQNSIFRLILDQFWKKRKKSIFFPRFFICGSPKNASIEYSTGLEMVVEYPEGLQNGLNPSPKFFPAIIWRIFGEIGHFVKTHDFPERYHSSIYSLKSLN